MFALGVSATSFVIWIASLIANRIPH
jgi:hypothetical protein